MDTVKKINVNNFKIEKNILSFNNSMVQISNISQVGVASPPKKPFNGTVIAAIVFGLLMSMIAPALQMVGVILVLGGIGYIILYISSNSNEDIYLNISLNSGGVYSIICKDKDFLKEVMQVIEYCINNHYNQIVSIDFNECNISNSPIISGNNNKVSL